MKERKSESVRVQRENRGGGGVTRSRVIAQNTH